MRGSCGGAIRVYTPHGGSLHYSRGSPVGLLYLTLEQVLMRRTELFLFESRYGRDVFAAKIGTPDGLVRVVHNGVTAEEFAEVAPMPTQPISCSSANCACSRASTCCSTRSRSSKRAA